MTDLWQCQSCEGFVSSEAQLWSHRDCGGYMKRVEGVIVKEFICETCERVCYAKEKPADGICIYCKEHAGILTSEADNKAGKTVSSGSVLADDPRGENPIALEAGLLNGKGVWTCLGDHKEPVYFVGIAPKADITGAVLCAACRKKQEAPLTGFVKNDSGKNQLDLIAPHFEWALGQVLTKGAKKYSRGNYLKGADWSRYAAAAKRHINQWLKGENLDTGPGGTGESHLANAAACLMILFESQRLGVGKDDRAEIHGGK